MLRSDLGKAHKVRVEKKAFRVSTGDSRTNVAVVDVTPEALEPVHGSQRVHGYAVETLTLD